MCQACRWIYLRVTLKCIRQSRPVSRRLWLAIQAAVVDLLRETPALFSSPYSGQTRYYIVLDSLALTASRRKTQHADQPT